MNNHSKLHCSSYPPGCAIFFYKSEVVKHVKGSHKVVKWRNPEAQGDKVYLAFFFINSLSKSKYRSYILMVSVFLQKWLRNVVSPRWEQSPKWRICQSDQQFASVHRSGSYACGKLRNHLNDTRWSFFSFYERIGLCECPRFFFFFLVANC